MLHAENAGIREHIVASDFKSFQLFITALDPNLQGLFNYALMEASRGFQMRTKLSPARLKLKLILVDILAPFISTRRRFTGD